MKTKHAVALILGSLFLYIAAAIFFVDRLFKAVSRNLSTGV